MNKTIETAVIFNNIGKAIAERSGFEPVTKSIDVATLPQETLLRLAHQGAKIFMQRLFADSAEAKLVESEYLESIAHMLEAWREGAEWRVKTVKAAPKVKATDFEGKAIIELRTMRINAQKGDPKDIEQQKAAQIWVIANQQDKIAAMAAQLKALHEFKLAMAVDVASELVVDEPTEQPAQDEVDF
jgi:hypothetical protein